MNITPGPHDTPAHPLPCLTEPCGWGLTTCYVTSKLTPFPSSSVAFAEMQAAQDRSYFRGDAYDQCNTGSVPGGKESWALELTCWL